MSKDNTGIWTAQGSWKSFLFWNCRLFSLTYTAREKTRNFFNYPVSFLYCLYSNLSILCDCIFFNQFKIIMSMEWMRIEKLLFIPFKPNWAWEKLKSHLQMEFSYDHGYIGATMAHICMHTFILSRGNVEWNSSRLLKHFLALWQAFNDNNTQRRWTVLLLPHACRL